MNGDAFDWTPEMALEHALEFVKERDPDAVVVICLSKGVDGKDYNTNFCQSGLMISEIIALLEIQKKRLMDDMHCEREGYSG
jgi:hypothetical protein